ncbi:MAG: hypothetical protein AABW73_03610 [Nanoarchaeota archaeon]
MKKQAKDLVKGDIVVIADQKCKINNLEVSDMGKQGTKKVRFEAINEKGEKIVLVRPADYPFDVLSK